jgi:hypothetical protein
MNPKMVCTKCGNVGADLKESTGHGDSTVGALVSAITLFLVTTPALAASPQVEAAVKVFQAVGADPNRLKTFCELMEIEEEMGEKDAPALNTQMDKLLDQLGADFKGAWSAAEEIDGESPDGKVVNAALDRLKDKCPD